MPNDTDTISDTLDSAVGDVQRLVDATEALLEDARTRNAHRITDLAGTVQVGHEALQRVHRALRRETTS
jgi:ABC-type transporter Mla subunit MlaD